MPDLTSPKLTKRQYFVVASLLFGLFFGAGNLIFPLHLGQLAGSHWVGAAAGFLVTGVLLPLLSVMAPSPGPRGSLTSVDHWGSFSPSSSWS